MRTALLCLTAGALAVAGCKPTKFDADGKPITLGQYRVRTYPKGAKIWVDGKLKAISTPATLVLDAGEYHLKIQADKAEPYFTDIEVEAGTEKTLNLRIPAPPPSSLTVISDEIGADVRVNGYRRGATPVHEAVTKPGPVDITVTTVDGRARSVKTRLGIAETKRVEVLFNRTSTAAAEAKAVKPDEAKPRGLLTLGLQPNGTVRLANGKRLGRTPIQKLPIEAGKHDLVLVSEDGTREKRVRIAVEPGQHAVYRFMLKKEDIRPAPLR